MKTDKYAKHFIGQDVVVALDFDFCALKMLFLCTENVIDNSFNLFSIEQVNKACSKILISIYAHIYTVIDISIDEVLTLPRNKLAKPQIPCKFAQLPCVQRATSSMSRQIQVD